MHEEQGEDSEESAFGILPENWEAAHVFFSCATQWHRESRTLADRREIHVLSGLRYEAVDSVINHGKFEDPHDVFHRVQVMERAAVEQAQRMAPR